MAEENIGVTEDSETPEWKNIGLIVIKQMSNFDKRFDALNLKIDDLPNKLSDRLDPKFDRMSSRIDRNHKMILSYGLIIGLIIIGMVLI